MTRKQLEKERSAFIAQFQAEASIVPPVEQFTFRPVHTTAQVRKALIDAESDARAILRDAQTIERLSIAQCNGDYPCDNGERRVVPCARCEAGYVHWVLLKSGICPECRAEDRIRRRVEKYGFRVEFSGDPRGYTTKVYFPSNGDGWGVPTRS